MFAFTLKLMLVILAIFSPFIIGFIGWNIYFRKVKGIHPKQGGTVRRVGHGSKLKRIFWDFPRQFVLDSLMRDPDEFREYGFHMICGEQGSGKTVSVAYMLRRMQRMYPKLVVKTNFGYKLEQKAITHWHDIVDSNNGIYGEIDVIDEVQNWFNSLQSKDFPMEFMTDITQQRKQRKTIWGTSQVFTRTAKPIREQTYWLYLPITLFGCLTIVRKYKPRIHADSGKPDEKKLRGMFFFVHDEELRNIFDTYDRIQKMAEHGFKSEQDQIRRASNTSINA